MDFIELLPFDIYIIGKVLNYFAVIYQTFWKGKIIMNENEIGYNKYISFNKVKSYEIFYFE